MQPLLLPHVRNKNENQLVELKNTMESLLTTLQCPVCLVLVEREVVLCVNGHATCKKCRGKMTTCPTCRASFSNLEQNTVFSQILDIIPHPCRFDKCSSIAKAGDDHEIYCKYRPTKCEHKNCAWIGSVDNITFHIEDTHPKKNIYSSDSGSKISFKLDKTFVDSDESSLISACGHYFWQKIVSCNVNRSSFLVNQSSFLVNQSDKYFLYTPLWVGKPKDDIYIRIWFKSEKTEFDAGVRVKTNKNNLKNKEGFLLPNSFVENFYNDNTLTYHLLISEKRNETIEMLLKLEQIASCNSSSSTD